MRGHKAITSFNYVPPYCAHSGVSVNLTHHHVPSTSKILECSIASFLDPLLTFCYLQNMRTGKRYLLLGVTLRDIHVETSYMYVMDVKINSPLARAPPVATTLTIVWYASCSQLTAYTHMW